MAKSAALETRVVSINFAQGLDQKTDPKLTTKLTTADNVVMRKNGTIEKRPGFVANGTWSISANPIRIFPFGDSEFAITDWATDTNSSDTNTPSVVARVGSTWKVAGDTGRVNSGNFLPANLRSRPLLTNSNNVRNFDLALLNKTATAEGTIVAHAAYAFPDSNTGSSLVASDISTESFFGSGQLGLPKSRMVSITNTSVTSYLVSSYDPSTAALSATVNVYAVTASQSALASSLKLFGAANLTTPQLDACAIGTKIFVAYKATSGTALIAGYYDTAGGSSATVSINCGFTPDMVSVAVPDPSTDRFRVFWARNSTSTGGSAEFSLTMSTINSATTALISVGGTPTQILPVENSSLTGVTLFVTVNSSTPSFSPSVAAIEIANGFSILNSNAPPYVGNCQAIAKPFYAHGHPHLVVQHDSPATQAVFVLRHSKSIGSGQNIIAPVARGLFGIAGPNYGTTADYDMVPNVVKADNDVWYTAARRAVYFNAENGQITVNYGLNLLQMNLSQTAVFPYEQAADATYVGAGVLSEFDGAGVVESGFLGAPTIAQVSVTTTGGSMTIGTYSIVAVKEWTDRRGRTHQSQPSQPITFATSTTTSSITARVYEPPSIRNTARGVASGDSVEVRNVFYRTTANGSFYYRDAISSFGSGVVPWIRQASLTVSDATLAGGTPLYTQGGRLPNWTPDSVEAMCVHGDRMFCADGSDPTIIRYSNEFVQGEGVAFSFLNTIPVPGVGRITALGSLDSNGIIFRQREIFAFAGNGPDVTGQNGTFSDPQQLFFDVGCIDQRNMCRFRDGIVFKSPDKGFYLLTRDLQLQPIGADVENYNSKTVVSSEVVALTEASGAVEECRFLCSDGTLLTYNYYNGQWTTASLPGCTDAVQSGGRYVVVNPSSTAANARVFQQSLSTYTDAFSNTSVTYQMTVETGWIKTADVQGFQRIWKAQLIGEAQGPGAISVEVGYDYETAYNETYTFNMSTMTTPNYTGGAQSIPQCDWVPGRQKCQAIRFRIKDHPTTGAVMKITNLSLECGVKSGVFKLPAAKGA